MVKMQNFVIYIDIDSFIVHVKTEDFYKDIVKDVEKKIDTSNFWIRQTIA